MSSIEKPSLSQHLSAYLGPAPNTTTSKREIQAIVKVQIRSQQKTVDLQEVLAIHRIVWEKSDQLSEKFIKDRNFFSRLLDRFLCCFGTRSNTLKDLQQLSTTLLTTQLQALTSEQLQALTSEQLQALTARQLQALTPEQLQALTPEQLQALTVKQIHFLTPEQIQRLREDQVTILATHIIQMGYSEETVKTLFYILKYSLHIVNSGGEELVNHIHASIAKYPKSAAFEAFKNQCIKYPLPETCHMSKKDEKNPEENFLYCLEHLLLVFPKQRERTQQEIARLDQTQIAKLTLEEIREWGNEIQWLGKTQIPHFSVRQINVLDWERFTSQQIQILSPAQIKSLSLATFQCLTEKFSQDSTTLEYLHRARTSS